MTRVLIGEALVNENERLQARINALLDKFEAALKPSLRVASTRGRVDAGLDFERHGQRLVQLRHRRWQAYAKSVSPANRWRNGRSKWPMPAVAILASR